MYSPNFVIGIYGPKSIQKHITVETEAAPYEITIGLLEICSLGHRRQIWHNHRKVDVWDDIWTSYRDLGVTFLICTNLTPVTFEAQIYRTTACSRMTFKS